MFACSAALTRVRQSYLAAIERLRLAGDTIEIVNGNAPSDRVHDAIWSGIQNLLVEPQ